MAQSQPRKIDDFWFEFYPLAPKEAIKVLTRLVKLVGEPLGLIGDQVAGQQTGGGLKSVLDANIGSDAFGKAAKALCERLDEREVEETIWLLLSRVHGQFQGDQGTRPLRIDVDFAGRIFLMLKVVGVALEVNFGDFFGGSLGSLISKSQQVRTAMKPAAEASIG